MKKITWAFITLLLIGLALPAFADSRYKISGTIKNYRVMELDSGQALLILTMDNNANTYGTLPSCADKSHHIALDLNSKMSDEVMSMTMTSHISGLEVTVASPLTSESNQCIGERTRMSYMNVREIR